MASLVMNLVGQSVTKEPTGRISGRKGVPLAKCLDSDWDDNG